MTEELQLHFVSWKYIHNRQGLVYKVHKHVIVTNRKFDALNPDCGIVL